MNILVTGAAGLVGTEITAGLAGAGHDVIALVRRRSELIRNDGRRLRSARVRMLPGDVTRPGLGLAGDIAPRLDLVVHSAAITDFGRPAQLYREVNLDGTVNVLRFATSRPGGPIPMIHISTAYVCGERDDTVLEGELDQGQRFGNDYERTKCLAEAVLRQEMATGFPCAVIRPSIVVGAERTGVIRDFKNLYVALKVFTRGQVRSAPGYYDALLDIVPIDHLRRFVLGAVERFPAAAGQTFHVLGASPLSLADLSATLAEYPSLCVPKFIPPEIWRLDRLPAAEQRYYTSILSLYRSYALRRARFDDRAAVAFLAARPAAQPRTQLRRLLDYGLRAGYLGEPSRRASST